MTDEQVLRLRAVASKVEAEGLTDAAWDIRGAADDLARLRKQRIKLKREAKELRAEVDRLNEAWTPEQLIAVLLQQKEFSQETPKLLTTSKRSTKSTAEASRFLPGPHRWYCPDVRTHLTHEWVRHNNSTAICPGPRNGETDV